MSEEEKDKEFVREIIAKQQWYEEYRKMKKENEELKEDIKEQWEENCRLALHIDKVRIDNKIILESIAKNYIRKDKIKNKIKELEDIRETLTDSNGMLEISSGIDILKELLEEQMIQQDIINLYNKGYSTKQIVDIIYRQSFDYKTGRYSLSKSAILHIFEKTILEYLKGGEL